MAIAENRRRAAVVTLNPKKTEEQLNRKIERLSQLAKKKVPDIIRQCNRDGLLWIQLRAKQNLEAKIEGNKRPHFRSFRLERAILSNSYSTADGHGIKFLIDKKIRTDVPYYASLEYGDKSQIGRRIPFFFLSTGSSPFSANRAGAPESAFRQGQAPDIKRVTSVPNGSRSDRLIGPREYKSGAPNSSGGLATERHTAIIRRPVPKYRYGRNAGDSFISERIYEQILDSRIATSGLQAESVKFVLTGR